MNYLEANTDLKKQHLTSLNSAVLNIINHKKYPLHHNYKHNNLASVKYRMHKEQTSPKQEHSIKTKNQRLEMESRVCPKRQNFRLVESSMGEHLQLLQGKKLESPYSSSSCFEEVNKKILEYLWQKRKYKNSTEATRRQLQQIDTKNEDQKYREFHSNKSAQSVSKLLKTLRKNLINEFVNQSEYSEFEATSVNHLKIPKSTVIDFYEGQRERIEIAKKYPVRKVDKGEDINKELERELVKDLKEKQNTQSDKYSKMRMQANHRKIISMG